MRLAFTIGLAISFLFLPWWAGALILLSACFLIDRYYEAIVFGILADALYAPRSLSPAIHGFSFMATAYALAVFLLALALRKRMAW